MFNASTVLYATTKESSLLFRGMSTTVSPNFEPENLRSKELSSVVVGLVSSLIKSFADKEALDKYLKIIRVSLLLLAKVIIPKAFIVDNFVNLFSKFDEHVIAKIWGIEADIAVDGSVLDPEGIKITLEENDDTVIWDLDVL